MLAAAVGVALALAAVALQGRGATAQTPPGPEPAVASEATLSLSCGPLRRQYVRTHEAPFNTTSTSFVPVPFMTMNASVVAGPGACVIVTFNAEFATDPVDMRCFVQALIGGVPMSPTGSGERNAIALDSRGGAVAMVWAHRPAANATVPVSIRIRSSQVRQCYVDDPVLRIEVFG
jgi:hypothetical protein